MVWVVELGMLQLGHGAACGNGGVHRGRDGLHGLSVSVMREEGERGTRVDTDQCWMPRMMLALSQQGWWMSARSVAMLSALVPVDMVSGHEQHWEAAKAAAGESALENFQLTIGFG